MSAPSPIRILISRHPQFYLSHAQQPEPISPERGHLVPTACIICNSAFINLRILWKAYEAGAALIRMQERKDLWLIRLERNNRKRPAKAPVRCVNFQLYQSAFIYSLVNANCAFWPTSTASREWNAPADSNTHPHLELIAYRRGPAEKLRFHAPTTGKRRRARKSAGLGWDRNGHRAGAPRALGQGRHDSRI